jgi:hypothetical protein
MPTHRLPIRANVHSRTRFDVTKRLLIFWTNCLSLGTTIALLEKCGHLPTRRDVVTAVRLEDNVRFTSLICSLRVKPRARGRLNELATKRGQSLYQMALAWVLRDARITTVLIGANSVEQLDQNLACFDRREFTGDELDAIEGILKS